MGLRTVRQSYQWIMANLPGDATVVIECRNLVAPTRSFKGTNVRQLRDRTYEDYVAQGVDYLVASSQCYGPYLESPQKFPREYGEYRALFSRMREVARFTPPRGYPWPEMVIYKVEPYNAGCGTPSECGMRERGMRVRGMGAHRLRGARARLA